MFGKISKVVYGVLVVSAGVANGFASDNFSYEEMIASRDYVQECIKKLDNPRKEDFIEMGKMFVAGSTKLKKQIDDLENLVVSVTVEMGYFDSDECIPVPEVQNLALALRNTEKFLNKSFQTEIIKLSDRKSLISDIELLYQLTDEECYFSSKNLVNAKIRFWQRLANEVSDCLETKS